MRGLALTILIASFAIGACKKEPTFDERYEAAQEEIRETADNIDEDLNRPSPTAKQADDPDGEAANSQAD